ncbi:MAG: SpoIID/LytB domain-containing protein [Phycisphaerales bacterium]|nr:SpoIID/LytB domain-containing protein [Phycisphaerales bacterium]
MSQESWPTFHDEALQAQAVASRTYALYIMSERDKRLFDLRAGEGDQVYRGVRRDAFGRRAAEAVDATRGVVLSARTPKGLRIFCAYYSAACGGHTQSVTDYMGGGDAPEPLAHGVACDFCRIAKGEAYRWKPRSIAKVELLGRLKDRDEAFADWTEIATVAVTGTTEFGRIGQVTLTGADDAKVVMGPETFRLAVGSRVMRSTDCTLTDLGDTLEFTNGKGFGHGVGMCQWGAEGQARAGRQASVILHHYYPGAQIVRAY